MTKTLSGIVLLAGLFVAILSGALASVSAGSSDLDPSQDWQYDLIQYGGTAGVIVGAVMFFVGAAMFSRK